MDGAAKHNYRTRSWDESITEHHTLPGGVHQVELQPGNATRYRMVFTPVPLIEHRMKSGSTYQTPAHWIVSLPDFNASMEVQDERQGFLHWSYVQEKLSDRRLRPFSPADMVPVTEMIGRIVGRPTISSEDQERRDEARAAEEAAEAEEEARAAHEGP